MSVLVWPARIVAGLNEQVNVEGQTSVMLPVKLLGAEAAIVNVVDVLPIIVVTLGVEEDSVNCATPVPERATDWGLPTAVSLIDKEPFLAPLEVGEKLTLMAQLWPGLRTFNSALQVFVCEKSPEVLMPVIFSVAVPVFVIVTVWAALTSPTVTFPKARLVGVTVTAVAAVTPVPLTLIVWGLPAALSVSVNVPVSTCVADGVKVMLMVQVPPLAATVPTQLSVSAKSPV